MVGSYEREKNQRMAQCLDSQSWMRITRMLYLCVRIAHRSSVYGDVVGRYADGAPKLLERSILYASSRRERCSAGSCRLDAAFIAIDITLS